MVTSDWRSSYGKIVKDLSHVTEEMLAMSNLAQKAIDDMKAAQSDAQRIAIARTALDKIAADHYITG